MGRVACQIFAREGAFVVAVDVRGNLAEETAQHFGRLNVLYNNAGQDCCARSRAFVQRGIYEEFLEALVTRTRRLHVGDPQNSQTEIGPLISLDQRRKVEGYIRLGMEEGAVVACGGKATEKPDLKKGAYLLPTILNKTTPTMRVVREEIFGPVLCVMPFKDEEEAIRLANDSEYGLSGSLELGLKALKLYTEVKNIFIAEK